MPVNKWLCLCLFFISTLSYSQTYLEKTRLIIKEADKEETVNIKNVDAAPVLLQIWVDTGNMQEDVSTTKTPFLITQPMVSLGGRQSHQIRVLVIDASELPTDRESIFWLNILELKEKAKEEQSDKVNIAFRTRIKLFYRPTAISPFTIENTDKQLTFTLLDANTLKIENPTPLYKTFLHAEKENNNKSIINGEDMISPFSSTTWNINKQVNVGDKINYSVINESGLGIDGVGIVK